MLFLRRRLLSIVLLCVALLAVVVGLGWFPQDPVRGAAERRLRAALGPNARIGALHIVPATLTGEIADLVLDAPGYRLEIPRARVALSPATLFGDVLALRVVELENPRLSLRPQPASPGAPAPFAKPISIGRLTVTGATLSYDDPALGGRVRFDGVALHGSVGSAELALTAAGGVWERQRPVAIGPAQARVRISKRFELRVESFDAGLLQSRVTAQGSLGNVFALAPQLDFKAQLDLSELAALARIPDASGRLAVEGHVGGAALDGNVTLRADALRIAGWTLDRLKADATRAGTRATASLSADLLDGHAAAQARLEGTALTSRLQLTGIAVQRIPVLPRGSAVTGVLGAEWKAHGPIDGALETEGHLELSGQALDLDLTSRIAASGSYRPRQAQMDLHWNAALDATATAGGRLREAHLALEGAARGPLPPAVDGSLDGTLAVQGARGVENVAVQGRFESQQRRLQASLDAHGFEGSMRATLTALGAAIEQLHVEGQAIALAALVPGAGGRAQLSFDGSGTPPRLSGDGRAAIDALVFQGAALGPVGLDVHARAGEAALRLAAPSLALTAEGAARLPEGRLQARVALKDTLLAPLAPLLATRAPVEGRVSGIVDLTVPLASPAATRVDARLEALEARSASLEARLTQPLRLRLEDGRVSVDALAVEGSGLTLAASGSFGLDPRAPAKLDVHAALALDRVPAPSGATLGGSVTADVQIAGTRARPRADGRIVAKGLSADTTQLPPLAIPEASLEIANNVATLTGMHVVVAGGSIDATGRLPLAALFTRGAAEPATLDVTWQGLQAEALLERLRPGDTAVAATLAGRAHVEGGLRSLAGTRGSLEMPETTLQIEDQTLRLEPLRVTLADGRLSTDGVVLAAEGGSFRLSGGTDLLKRTLDVAGHGTLDLRTVSPFLKEAALTGTAAGDVTLTGGLDAPRTRGALDVHDGTLRLRMLQQALTSLEARVAFDGRDVRIENGSALFGGGTVRLGGQASLGKGGLENVRLEIGAREIGLRYPPGLRTRLAADLTLRGKTGAFVLAGPVTVEHGLYDLDVAVQSSLGTATTAEESSPALRQIALDIRVGLANPIVVRNNLGRLQVGGGLQFRGDAESPRPYGRLELLEGGVLQLQATTANVFLIDASSSLTYEGTWNPTLSIKAHTKQLITPANPDRDKQPGEQRAWAPPKYRIDVAVTGALESPVMTASATPSLSSEDIFSLLTTGMLGNVASGEKAVAGDPATALLTGRLTTALARELSELGLGEVTIQPELVAREIDPGARFTFRKTLSRGFQVIYSLSVKDPQQRFVRVEAEPGRNLQLTGQRNDDGSFTYGAGQEIAIGGRRRNTTAASEEAAVRLADVRVEGAATASSIDFEKQLKLRRGQKVLPWDVQQEADRIRERLAAAGHLDAVVGARLDAGVAVVTVQAGPRYLWRIEGMPDAADLDGVFRRALFAQEAIELAETQLVDEMAERGHLRASVQTRKEGDTGTQTLVFVVTPGPALRVADVSFPGAQQIPWGALTEAAGGPRSLVREPALARKRLESYYRERHYVAARVELPRVRQTGAELTITVAVTEGARARLAAVRFEGATLPAETLAQRAGLVPGGPYSDADLQRAAGSVRDHYLSLGFPGARVSPELLATPEGDVEAVLRVIEGDAVRIRTIEIVGLTRTRESLVRSKLRLTPGDPLDPRRLAGVEQRVAALGVFASVTVVSSPDDPSVVRVEVVEQAPLVARYDLRYDTEEKGTLLADLEARNIFGRGLTAGARYNVGRRLREARGSFHLPALFGSGTLIGSVFHLEDDVDAVDFFNPGVTITNTRLRRGFEIQQDMRLRRRLNLLYRYRFRRVSSTTFPLPIDIAGLDVSLINETRDKPLDARRGRFLSLNLELTPKILGSDFRFMKATAQASLIHSFRDSLAWAHAYRVGLARGFGGQHLISDDRFRAGGANSLRGFANDSVGPKDILGDASGGEAVVIVNQELRLRHASGIGGAFFYDGGNVFETLGDLSFDWRHSLGIGLRYDTPVGVLLRVDVGFPLGRKPGEKSYQWFFSIGQAF